MAVDPLVLRNLILQKLTAAGYDTSCITQDYWYAIAKALTSSFGEGSIDDHLVKADPTDLSFGPLSTKTKGVNGITLSVIEEGGVKKLQISGPTLPAPDDHLVKASDSDATAVGSLQAKTKGVNGITLSLVTEGGVQKLQISGPTLVTLSSAIPEPDGTGSAGNLASNRAAAEGHVHPLSTKSKMYSGVTGGLNRGSVDACYIGTTTCVPVLFYGWTEGPANTWTKDSDEPLYASHCDDVEPFVGMAVVAWQNGLGNSDRARSGRYVVDALGGSGTHAVLRRSPDFDESDEFICGMAFNVLGGTIFGGHWITLTTKEPITLNVTPLTWESTDQSPEAAQQALFTESQLTSTVADTIIMSANIVDTDGTVLLYNSLIERYSVFDTLVGTPALSIIPAGTVSAQVQARLTTSLGNGTTEIVITVQKQVGEAFVDVCSAATTVDLFAWTLKEISQTIAEQSIDLAALMRLTIRARTTSTEAVGVEIIVNDSTHTCLVEIPVKNITLPHVGDHETLLRKNSRIAGVGQHTDTAIDLSGVAGFDSNLIGKYTLDEAMEVVDDLKSLTTVRQPHGWPIDTVGARLVSLSYDAATRKVTVTALSGDSFEVWVHGVKFTYASPYVSAAHTATEGGWFLYHDGTGFEWTQVQWNLYSVAPVAYVYWSSVGSSGQGFYELHGWSRDIGWHNEQHSTNGTMLISGGTLADYLLDTDTDAALQFSIAATIIADEDIMLTRAQKADGAGFTIWTRSGVDGYWTWTTGNTFPFYYATYPQKNHDPGTGWTTSDISGTSGGNYLTTYVLVTPSLDTDHRYVIIPGQTEYTTLSAAKFETPSALNLGTLPFQEFVAIAQLVFHASVSFGGTAKAELVSVTRLSGPRGSFSSTALVGTHNSLTGLQGGASGSYYHTPEWENDDTKFLRSDGIWIAPSAGAGWISAVPPIDANDQAVFLFDDVPVTSPMAAGEVAVNTGYTAGNLTYHAGTVQQGAFALKGSRGIHMMTDSRLISATNMWEYQTLSIHFWFFLEGVVSGLGDPVVGIVKASNPGAYSTPYYSVSLTVSSSAASAAILHTVSPRTYVALTNYPNVNQFIIGQWYHIAMTWDGTYLILYINGNEWSRSAAQTGITVQYANHGEWVLGHQFTKTSTSKFVLQDLRINDTALSAAYIADVFHRGHTLSDRMPSLY